MSRPEIKTQKHSSSFQFFLGYVKPYWHLILIASLAGVLRYLIPLCVPWGIKVVVDDLLSNPPVHESWLRLHRLIGALIALYGLWLIASFTRLYFTGLAGNRIIFDLRHRLFLHIQRMSLDFFEKRKIGSIVTRVIQDIAVAQQLVGSGVTAVLMDVSSVALIAAIMLKMNPQLALVSLSFIPFYVAVSKYFSKRIRRTSRDVHQHLENLSGNLHEKVGGIATVQIFGRDKEEEEAFLKDSQAHYGAVLANVKQQALGLSLTGFLVSVAPLIVIWYGAMGVFSGTLSVGTLIAFYSYVGLLYAPIARLTELNVVIASSLAAIDRIFEIFRMEPEVCEKPHAIAIKHVSGRIAFDRVAFAYPDDRQVLRQISFEIQPGECVALTGPSGSGKSTIVKLLLRFYDVQSGNIFIDGADIQGITLASLRESIAYVSQEPILFSGTLLENILYGRRGTTEKEGIEAAKAAFAHEFILRLPHCYETQIGERGLRLSVGEKQRIAMARAFLKNAPILVLDEPTSALDEESAYFVRRGIENLGRSKTTLIVEHRPTAIYKTDRKMVLSEGLILESNYPLPTGVDLSQD